jgi:hypothetical protein
MAVPELDVPRSDIVCRANKGERFTSRRHTYPALTGRDAAGHADLGTYWAQPAAVSCEQP